MIPNLFVRSQMKCKHATVMFRVSDALNRETLLLVLEGFRANCLCVQVWN